MKINISFHEKKIETDSIHRMNLSAWNRQNQP